MTRRNSRQLEMTEPTSLKTAIAWARAELTAAGISSPRADAEILAAHLLKIPRGELAAALISGHGPKLNYDAYRQLVRERAQRAPLQHLTGIAPFRSLELAVGPGVFIPRPENETVAQVAIDAVNAVLSGRGETLGGCGASPSSEQVIAVDLCTGSGAIALALVAETRAAAVYAVELSELTFAGAEQDHNLLNARYGPEVASRLLLRRADATDPTTLAELDGQVDVVVTNPPYIPPDSVPVDTEVREHDPQIALYGRGADGLEIPGAVLNRAQALLRPGGVVIMEHAEVQAAALRHLAAATGGWEEIQTLPDLAGRARMLYAKCSDSVGKVEE